MKEIPQMQIKTTLNGRASRAVMLTAAAVALLACSPTAAVKKLDAAQVAVVPKAGASVPTARRTVLTPIEAKAGGTSVAADCTLSSEFFTAAFKAPANIQIPDYGNKSPSLTVACTAPQGKGSVTRAPVSVARNNASTAGWMMFGVIGGIVASESAKDKDGDHFYSSINVALK
jgi:hypothetical protein